MRMIIAENLKKVYGGDIVSVDDLSFHIHKGEIVGFVDGDLFFVEGIL